jgi:hypothetical protein
VTIVPGESIGEKKLAGRTSVQVEVEASKSYCVFGIKLGTASTLVEAKAAAPQTCTQAALVGVTHLDCDEEGVALSFAGPQAAFHHVTIYPKGSPAPVATQPAGTPSAGK